MSRKIKLIFGHFMQNSRLSTSPSPASSGHVAEFHSDLDLELSLFH